MILTSRARVRALAVGGLVAGAFAVFGAAAPGAHAVTLFTCTGSDVGHYSPGITNTPGTVQVSSHSVLGPCLNVLNPLELRTGEVTLAPHTVSNASCLRLDNVSSGTGTISWSNGHSTTYSYNQTLSEVAGVGKVIVRQGTITSGDFNGDAILVEIVFASTQFLNCATTGETSTAGPVELTITG